jgi:transposase
MLYVVALHASRRSQAFAAFRSRQLAACKRVEAAIAATARKLLDVLDAMLTTGTEYRQTNPD